MTSFGEQAPPGRRDSGPVMRRGVPLLILVCLAAPVLLLGVMLGSNRSEQHTSSTIPGETPPTASPSSPISSSPAATGEVARWTVESADAVTVARDSSGHGNEGRLTNVRVTSGQGGHAYRFDGRTSRVVIPDAPSLNPGLRDFSYSVTVRFRKAPIRWDSYDLLRKGNTTSVGGLYKVEIVNINGLARARCTARDELGRTGRTTPRTPDLGDHSWHVITCARTGTSWTARVDGTKASKDVALGGISSIEPVTLGAKLQHLEWDDWFPGDLADARLSIGVEHQGSAS